MKASKIKIEIASVFLEVILLAVIFTGCDQSRKNVTTNGTQDTSSVTKAGGPAITDTATISAQQKANKSDSVKGDTTGKGNADPTGRPQKK